MTSRQVQFAIPRKPLHQPFIIGQDVLSGPSPIELNQLGNNSAELQQNGHVQDESILVVPEESTTSEEVPDHPRGHVENHQATVQVQNFGEEQNSSTRKRRFYCGWCRRKDWPTEPKSLPKFAKRIRVTITEILLVFIASGFLVLGSFIIALNGVEQSKFGDGVIQTTLIIPSIWPLFFSAGIGAMLKIIAHRKLQYGSSIRSLEQLMSSQTVLGTVMAVWTLRSLTLQFAIISLVLLMLWSLSPIGSQAILRVIDLEAKRENQTVSIDYMNTDPRRWTQLPIPYPNLSQGGYTSSQAIYQSLFTSALLSQGSSLQYLNNTAQQSAFDSLITLVGGVTSAVEKSAVDAWGNFRLPAYHLLPGLDPASQSNHSWVSISSEELPPYISGIGIPVKNLPSTGIGTLSFTIPVSYYKFQCGGWNSGFTDELPLFQLPPWPDQTTTTLGMFQTTLPFKASANYYQDGGLGPSSLPNGTNCDIPFRPILYYTPLQSITCLISAEYVEAMVQCSRGEAESPISCSAKAVRSSPDSSHLCPQITELEFANSSSFDELNYMNYVLALSEDTFYPSPAEAYLINPGSVAVGTTVATINISDIPPDIFQNRLGFVFNSWAQAARDPSLILGGNGTNNGYGYIPQFMDNTTATWQVELSQVYHIQTAWLAAYMISAIVLWICAFVALILRLYLAMPQYLLGSVSTLVRDSPYVDIKVPTPGSTLGGDERARLLRRNHIQLVDVKGDCEVGRIAVGSMVPGYSPIRRTKMYE